RHIRGVKRPQAPRVPRPSGTATGGYLLRKPRMSAFTMTRGADHAAAGLSSMKPVDTMGSNSSKITSQAYLHKIGVADLPPSTSPFDPGYDPLTLEGHLEQSAHLMSTLKISMACWLIAHEGTTRRKVAAARAHGVA